MTEPKLPAQEPLGEPFAKILHENLWDLYEGTKPSFYDKYHTWFVNAITIFALVAMLSPKVAATAVTPWLAFLVMNVIYSWDAYKAKNWGWASLCIFGIFWDILLIVSRSTQTDVFAFLSPLIKLLENLP